MNAADPANPSANLSRTADPLPCKQHEVDAKFKEIEG